VRRSAYHVLVALPSPDAAPDYDGLAANTDRNIFVAGLQPRHEQLDRLLAAAKTMQQPVAEVADRYRGDDVPELVVARMLSSKCPAVS
jgi:hypothetical protein